MKLKLPKESAFFERFGYFTEYGDGVMLVHWSGHALDYVLFTPWGSPKKVVINKELLDKYKKDVVEV